MLRANELEIGTWVLKTARRHRCRAGLRPDDGRATGDHWFVRETIGFLRRTLRGSTSPRAASSRSSTRAPALPAACSSWRSPPTAATCWREGPQIALERRSISAVSKWSTAAPGWRPASTMKPSAALERLAADAARRRRRRSSSASSPSRPTSSTGTTRSAWRSRSARACRPTR